LIKAFIGLLLVGCFGLAQAQEIARDALPTEGRQVMELIEAGGPFPYQRDGVVFGNFEKRLPLERRGYYREYTVPTPGIRHRGARRIVCGGWETRRPAACYYTADHYRSFRKISE
jgi:ribonuclease T1